MNQILFVLALMLAIQCHAFSPIGMPSTRLSFPQNTVTPFRMAEESAESTSVATPEEEEEEEFVDAATKLAMEKQKRADELRAQEVFIQRSTGIHKCSNCDWEFDVAKGDSFMIGGMIKPGTPFAELPSNYRCPRCRASKDSFVEVTEEIPGFEVNQGYGLGGNSMTSGQKNGIVFGGLGFFFFLFLAGYGLS